MIVHPKNWVNVGEPIRVKEIEDTIVTILTGIDCNCLSLSGGIDSSLTLYYLSKIHNNVFTFTIGLAESHPDVQFSRLVASKFSNVKHEVYIPTQQEMYYEKHSGDLVGDDAVRLFYKFVGTRTDKIVACDGLDEYMCGYYAHQVDPDEKTYYYHLNRLRKYHLEPLDKNSMGVKVYLPYIDVRLMRLLSQIPTHEKVDHHDRKKIVKQMAKGKIPKAIIDRRKYGFCDAFIVK